MREIGIGFIGGGAIARAHARGFRTLPLAIWPAPARPRLVAVADIDPAVAQAAAEQLGFERHTGDWQAVIADAAVEAVVIAAPTSTHRDIAIAAAQAGKHILCEKPLALSAADALAMVEAAERAGVVNMVGFNYRQLPAVAYARSLIAAGELGEVYHLSAGYYQDWALDPNVPATWRFQAAVAGSGALGDLASHAIDLARFLVGDITRVCARLERFVARRPRARGTLDALGLAGTPAAGEELVEVDVDDAVVALAEFERGFVGSLEASRFATGRKNSLTFAVHGSRGAVRWDFERAGELQLYERDRPETRLGFTTVLAGPAHPQGAILGRLPGTGTSFWDTKMLEDAAFVRAIVDGGPATPNFRDGLRAVEVDEAIRRSAASERWEPVARA